MKKFETPEIEIEKLEIADVITTSDEGDDGPLPCPFPEKNITVGM